MKKDASYTIKEDKRRKIIKTVILLVFAFLFLLIATIAWFAMNRATEVDGMSVSVAQVPFELKTTGSVVPNESIIEEFGFVDGTSVTGGRTTLNAGDIKWLLAPDDEMYTRGLSPNTYGSLGFSIVPAELDNSKEITVNYHLVVRAFRLTDEMKALVDAETDKMNRGLPYQMPEITIDDLIELPANDSALDYISGHILFFKNSDNTGRFKPNEVQTVTFNAGSEYTVPLHWVWPETLGNMILPSSRATNVCEGEEKTLLVNDIKNHPTQYFLMQELDSDFYDLVDDSPVIKDDVMGEDLLDCYLRMSMAYDSADQVIGVNVHYVLIELVADGTIADAE